jgi:hypothetical protein
MRDRMLDAERRALPAMSFRVGGRLGTLAPPASDGEGRSEERDGEAESDIRRADRLFSDVGAKFVTVAPATVLRGGTR